jgi:hypothetical protein
MMQDIPNQQAVSPTPYTDILRHSPYIKEINKAARDAMEGHEKTYSEAIREMKAKKCIWRLNPCLIAIQISCVDGG